MAKQNLGFTAAYARASLAAVCAFWSLMLVAHYFILFSPREAGEQRGYAWAAVVKLSEILGAVGLLVFGVLLAACAFIFSLQARKLFVAVKKEIGIDELDALRLDAARSSAEKAGLIGGMPAHLRTVEAFRAHRKRLKVLFFLFVAVFSCIGIAGAFDLLP